MPTVKISVSYNAEKLAAIKQFAPDEAAKLEAEMAAAVEKIYRRAVPAIVRGYIEGKAKSPGNTAKPEANGP
jgi:hypothetical protein